MGVFLKYNGCENMIIEVLIVSLIAGLIRGGSITNLRNIRFKGLYLVLLGIIINVLSFHLMSYYDNSLSIYLYNNLAFVQSSTMMLILVGLLFNHKETGFLLAASGIGLNTIPIAFNSGKMPVAQWALLAANLRDVLDKANGGLVIDKIIMSDETRFNFLADIIPIEYPLPKVISIGDVIMAIGIFLIIQKYMTLSQPLQD